jgi:hypothetical protein
MSAEAENSEPHAPPVTTHAPAGFLFVEKPAAYRDPEALVVHVPSAARGKEKLLGVLAKGLRFPKYFGWNWDALDECLRDLSWLGEVRKVTIVHLGLPFSPQAEYLALYIDLLAEAIAAQRNSTLPRELTVVFPAGVRELFA